MSEIFNDLPLIQLLGLNLPDDVSAGAEIETPGSIQNFIGASRTYMPGRTLLLDLVQQFPCNAKSGVELTWAVEESTSRTPGFSDNSPRDFNPHYPKTTLASHEVAAALVINERAQDESYKRHLIAEEAVRNVVAYCEGTLITGLLNADRSVSIAIEREDSEKRMAFYCRALAEYAKNARRAPTHIILPFTEMLLLHVEEKDNASVCIGKVAQGFPNKLYGIPVIVSDAIPESRGLILAVDDIVLASSPGLKWEFGIKGGNLHKTDSAIMLSFTMGLLIKQRNTVAQLALKGEQG